MNGLLFPGQGSQAIGMGKELYDSFLPAKDLMQKAIEILGYDIKKLMFEGPIEQLVDTRFAQPAIYLCSAMYFLKFKSLGFDYDCVAGHSLGEYSALFAAGVFDFETGLRLVSKRGEIMSKMNGKGTMAAVLGLTEEDLLPYLTSDVVIANINSRTQIVISGKKEGIDIVGESLAKREDVKFKRINVSAAFHSPQMEQAAEEMANIILEIFFKKPNCLVISNVTGKPTDDVEKIKNNLLAQITGQVRWCDTILSMKDLGIDTLYEIGYGDVLKKINKTITFKPKCLGVDF